MPATLAAIAAAETAAIAADDRMDAAERVYRDVYRVAVAAWRASSAVDAREALTIAKAQLDAARDVYRAATNVQIP